MRRIRGFTLVELLVVIGIIAVLVAMLIPTLSAARQRGLCVNCLSNMRQLGAAVVLYENDFNGALPYVADLLHRNGMGFCAVGGGPSPIITDGVGGAIVKDNTLFPYTVPAPQNRPLARYCTPTIYDDTFDGVKYPGVYHYDIWKCPADQGMGLDPYYESYLPTVWECFGMSYFYNDYQHNSSPNINQSDFQASIQTVKVTGVPQSSLMILFFEPPAQAVTYANTGKVFRWHSGQTGSFDWSSPGQGAFLSNCVFVDGHADTIDFTGSYSRDAQGNITGQSRCANNAYWWYIPK